MSKNRANSTETLQWLNRLQELGYTEFFFTELPQSMRKIRFLFKAKWKNWIYPIGKEYDTCPRIKWKINGEILR